MKFTLPTLLLLGAGAWVLFGRKKAAADVTAPSPTSSMPNPTVGEASAAYMDRVKAWGMQTGQMYPTMEGYGRTGPMWQSMGMVAR